MELRMGRTVRLTQAWHTGSAARVMIMMLTMILKTLTTIITMMMNNMVKVFRVIMIYANDYHVNEYERDNNDEDDDATRMMTLAARTSWSTGRAGPPD